MPHYDYECTKCGHVFEVFQSITEKPLTKCPKCKAKLRRLIGSGAGIIFKGSGFYATDYPKQGSKPPQTACPKQNHGCDGCKAKKE